MANFVGLALVLATAMVMSASYGQISTPCNPAALSTLFTPCMGFLTNSSSNGTSPTTQCCTALKSLTSGGMDCLCLIVTASVPFQLPINRSLAISLPRACNMPGVPVQCKASGSPLPAPGPVVLGPSPSPSSGFTTPTPTPTPQETASSDPLPSPMSPRSLAPQPDTTVPLLTPPSPSVDSVPTGSGRSALTPSLAIAITSYNALPCVISMALGYVVFKNY